MQLLAATFDCKKTCQRSSDGAEALLLLGAEWSVTATLHVVPTGSKPMPPTASYLHRLHINEAISTVKGCLLSMCSHN